MIVTAQLRVQRLLLPRQPLLPLSMREVPLHCLHPLQLPQRQRPPLPRQYRQVLILQTRWRDWIVCRLHSMRCCEPVAQLLMMCNLGQLRLGMQCMCICDSANPTLLSMSSVLVPLKRVRPL